MFCVSIYCKYLKSRGEEISVVVGRESSDGKLAALAVELEWLGTDASKIRNCDVAVREQTLTK